MLRTLRMPWHREWEMWSGQERQGEEVQLCSEHFYSRNTPPAWDPYSLLTGVSWGLDLRCSRTRIFNCFLSEYLHILQFTSCSTIWEKICSEMKIIYLIPKAQFTKVSLRRFSFVFAVRRKGQMRTKSGVISDQPKNCIIISKSTVSCALYPKMQNIGLGWWLRSLENHQSLKQLTNCHFEFILS